MTMKPLPLANMRFSLGAYADDLDALLREAYSAGFYTGVFDAGGAAQEKPVRFEDWFKEKMDRG